MYRSPSATATKARSASAPYPDGKDNGFGTTESSSKPDEIPADTWHAIYQNLLASIGSTDSNLYFTLLGDSQALVASGVSVIDFNDLLSFELLKADGIPAVTSVPTSEDLPDASSPFSLNFNRTYGEDIKGRFYNGPFGRGWSDNYDATVGLTNSGNDVSVFVDGTTESFVKAANGNFYATTPGDTNSLSLVNNRYQLSDKAGDVTTFASDGTLASISDAHGNTITASRNASGQISTLLDSSGKSLTFAYNANGHVSMITSSSGQTAVYGYDSTGQYLTSVTSPRGTTQYGYSVPTAGPTAYEITSITSPGGAQIQYVYDGQGRVVKQQGINGSVPLTYSYGAASYTVTDAWGTQRRSTTTWEGMSREWTIRWAHGHARRSN